MKLFNSGYILSNKRYGWIDYDRGISIILVGYRHCFENLDRAGIKLSDYPFLEYINVFLSGFRMPLFFIASGIFVSNSLRKRGLSPYLNNRLRTIFYPLIVWGSIQITLQIIFSKYANSDMHPIDYLYLLYNPRAIGQFWYLNALFSVGVVYSVLKVTLKLRLRHQLTLGLVLYTIVGYLRTKDIYLGFLMDILQYYIFFSLGDAVSTFIMNEKGTKLFSSWKLTLPLFIVFCFIQYYFTKINLEKGDYYVEHFMPFFFLLVAIIGCAFSISISFTLNKLKMMRFLRVVGYHSVYIYCAQILAIAFAKIIFVNILGFTNGLVLVALIMPCGIVLPMILYQICVRLNIWWVFTLKYPEEEIKYLSQSRMALQKA